VEKRWSTKKKIARGIKPRQVKRGGGTPGQCWCKKRQRGTCGRQIVGLKNRNGRKNKKLVNGQGKVYRRGPIRGCRT